MSLHKMLINGKVIDAPSTFGVINPSTGKVFAQAPDCSKAQCDEAVAAAKVAFSEWRNTSYETRKKVLDALVETTKTNVEALAMILVKEQGKPMSGAQFEIDGVIAFLEAFAQIQVEDKLVVDSEAEQVFEVRVPLGVVGGICPWNYPLLMATWKIAEAIMTGNCIVVKSSPYTPLTTNLWAELIADKVPAGVVNIVSGGNDCGQWLVEHADVAKISFTGSTRTGKLIQAAAAKTLKRLTLELGGNDAALILEDADPQTVAPAIMEKAMANSGQICMAVKRCYVPSNQYDQYIAEFKKAAQQHTMGDGFEQDVTMGPINNKMQFDRVCELVEDAKKNGAKVETGGTPSNKAKGGYYFPPTVLSNVTAGVRIVDEEQFGPVLPLIPYDSEEQVIEEANNTMYGLGGSVWGEATHAAKVARQIDAGTVWVNHHMNVTPDVVFGGRKCSGIGGQLGHASIEGYTDLKILRIPKAVKKEEDEKKTDCE